MIPEKPSGLPHMAGINRVDPDVAGPSTSRSGPAAPATRAGRAGRAAQVAVDMPPPGMDLSPERVKAEQKAMFTNAVDTARWRGSKAYGASFGAVGVGTRLAAGFIDDATGSDAGTLTTNLNKAGGMALALLMPLAHNTAGAKVAPVRFPFEAQPTVCVQPDPERPIPMGNLVGESFRPFIGYLSAGNTAMNALAQGAGFAANAGSGEDIGADVEKALNVVLPWAPGNLAATQTARNIVSGQLALGFSLSEPIGGHGDGNEGGRLVIHQKPVEKDNGPPELGHLTLQHAGTTYKLTVYDVPENEHAVVAEVVQPDTEPPQSLGAKALAFGRYFIPNHQTVAKTAALASTLVGIGAISLGLTPKLKEAMIANDVDPKTANEVAKATNYVLANHLLGTDFMQKFQSFTEPATSFADKVAKVGAAAIPVFGGAIAAARRPSPNIPGLNEGQFEALAQNKVAILKRIAAFSGQPFAVHMGRHGTTIDNARIVSPVHNETYQTDV